MAEDNKGTDKMNSDILRWTGVSLIALNILLAPWFLPLNYIPLVLGNLLLVFSSVKYKDYPTAALGVTMVVFGSLTLILN